MKAMLLTRAKVRASRIEPARAPALVRSAGKIDRPLLWEIQQLGGEERMKGAEGALDAFESALADLVRENPKRYGAADDAASQERVVSQLLQSVRNSFLSQTVENLRREAGYIKVCGRWVHRAVFTFIGFGILTASMLPFCAVSLMSTAAWGWLPGTIGLGATVLLGAWILSRVRNN
jgi:hypothetical protein